MSASPEAPQDYSKRGPRTKVLHPLDWAKRHNAFPDVLAEMGRELSRRRRRRHAGVVTAGLLLVATGVWWILPGEGVARRPAAEMIAQDRPAHRELPDGSLVEVRAGGIVRADYSASVRRVIVEAGDAHFQVAKNPAWPFVVMVGDIEVVAVGTAFAVQRRAADLEVIVTEGRVRVSRPAPRQAREYAGLAEIEPEALVELTSGDSALVATHSGERKPRVRVEALSPAAMAARLAWRVPVLDFSSTPLPEVVAQINRHGSVSLVLADAALRDVRLSGRLQADNVETLLRLLEEEHGVRVSHRSSTEIVLHSGR